MQEGTGNRLEATRAAYVSPLLHEDIDIQLEAISHKINDLEELNNTLEGRLAVLYGPFPPLDAAPFDDFDRGCLNGALAFNRDRLERAVATLQLLVESMC